MVEDYSDMELDGGLSWPEISEVEYINNSLHEIIAFGHGDYSEQ